MNVVRIWGDPFAEDEVGSSLRGFLRVATGSGVQVGLCLSAVQPGGSGGAVIELFDGVRRMPVRSALPPSELQMIVDAAQRSLPGTAPVLVFAGHRAMADALQLAGLEWPRSCRILKVAIDATASELLARVRSELHWAGTEDPEVGFDARELQPWLAVPPPQGEVILHLGSDDPADGSDIMVRVFVQRFAGARLRVLLPDDNAVALLRDVARGASPAGVEPAIEFVVGELTPQLLRDVAFAAQPLRLPRALHRLLPLLAAGRPLCISRFAAVADLLPGPGLCEAVGGRWLPAENGAPAAFEPDPRGLCRGMQNLQEPAVAQAIAQRARAHLLAELVCDRPAAPPPLPATPARSRPRVVLEAPFLETSSSAELSIATAAALQRRGEVELLLVPRVPFQHDLSRLRRRAPELVPLLQRSPHDVDLWLSSGWPVRAQRPEARTFAVRVDWEYGALPVQLTPVVTQEADLVVVHSNHVMAAVTSAGRPAEQVRLIPHGADSEVFHAEAPQLEDVLAWKQGRPAVLFVGGLIWRKGIDAFVRAVLAAQQAAPGFCVVVKGLGGEQHYGGYHLRELVQKVQRHPKAPPLLLIEDELSRPEMAGLFTACDVLLHPYRGEGFGMPVLEARACGLPVLVTEGGACDDFAVGDGAVKIPSWRRPVELPEVCVAQPWVLEPEEQAVGRVLVESLRRLPELTAAARRESVAVRQVFSWDAAAESIERLAREATRGRVVRSGRAAELQPV